MNHSNFRFARIMPLRVERRGTCCPFLRKNFWGGRLCKHCCAKSGECCPSLGKIRPKGGTHGLFVMILVAMACAIHVLLAALVPDLAQDFQGTLGRRPDDPSNRCPPPTLLYELFCFETFQSPHPKMSSRQGTPPQEANIRECHMALN